MSIGNDFGDAHIDVHADTTALREELRLAARAAGEAFGTSFGDSIDDAMRRHVEKMGRQAENDLERSGRRGGNRFSRGLIRCLRDYEGQTSVLGRLAGSRNNFLNILGRAAGAAENAISKVVDKLAELPAQFASLSSVFKDSGGGVGGLFAALGSLGGGGGDIAALAKLTVAFIALDASITFGAGALGVLTAALSGVAAIATALAGTLAFGIIAGVGVLGGFALAAAAGVGALATAFLTLDDAGKQAFKNALKPIGDWFTELGKTISGGFLTTFSSQIGGIKEILNGFVGPLLLGAAQSLNDVFVYLVEAFNRPEVKDTLTLLSQFLPPILSNLGKAFIDFLVGALGFFSQMAPLTLAFSQNLGSAASSLASLMNPKAENNGLETALAIASESLSAILDLAGSVGGALLNLFTQVAPTGNDFLTSLTGIVDEFNAWIQTEDGRAAIAGWMQFARDLADKLWGAIQSVGRMIDDLDSPQNRQSLLDIIDAFSKLIDKVDGVIQTLSVTSKGFGVLATGAINALGLIVSVFDKINQAIISATGQVKNFLSYISKIRLPDIGGAIKGLAESFLPHFAAGGITSGPTVAGEAGRELVIPLERPLTQIDPSVRWLSAMLQGKGSVANPTKTGGGNVMTVAPGAIMVQTAVADPAIVASMVFDRLVAHAT